MCETFKWIKLLAVESPKNGLQIPVDLQELFKVRQKCKYLPSVVKF